MGQYYKPINIDKKEFLNSHSFDNGLKLMEHSYIGNRFMEVVELLLIEKGRWYKDRIVWAGDYADVEPDTEGQGYKGKGENLYLLIDEEKGINPVAPYEIDKFKEENNLKDMSIFRYIVNHTLKQFVDKERLVSFDGWKIHPLSLLTAEGNGRGGGDYHEENPDSNLVGKWARCSISLEKVKPEGYEELMVNFKE